MRPPGGLTMDMFNYANDIDLYREWAHIVAHNRFTAKYSRPYHCCFAGRRTHKRYAHSHEEVVEALGARLVLTPAAEKGTGMVRVANELAKKNGWFLTRQFDNPANPEAHRTTTAEEIWEATGGEVDAFIAGVGTGGTITGVGEVLKARKPEVRMIAVEPVTSQVLAGKDAGPHRIQGIGAGFVPEVLNVDIIDEVVTVTNDDAFETARQLAQEEGILCGISSGAAVWAAQQVASRLSNRGKQIVVILPSTGERYISTDLFK